MSNFISVPPDVKNYLLCRCGRAEECGLRKTPPKLDAEDIQKLWLPVHYINRQAGSSFLEMKNAGPVKENAAYADREAAVKEYIHEMKLKVKALRVDTYPEATVE